jgi:hypothetical protein
MDDKKPFSLTLPKNAPSSAQRPPISSQSIVGGRESSREIPRKPLFARLLDNKARFSSLQEELASLPKAPSPSAIGSAPKDIGASILGHLGWKEGHALGRSTSSQPANAPIIMVPRPEFLGLGATPDEEETLGKRKRPLKVDKSGRVRHTATEDEVLFDWTPKKKTKGAFVWAAKGIHKGLDGIIDKVEGDRALIALRTSGAKVWIPLDCLDFEPPLTTTALEDEKAPEWMVMSGLKVLLIDREFEEGRYYFKTGEILDILPTGHCVLKMDEDGRMVDGLPAYSMRPINPSHEGQTVGVIEGPRQGTIGQVISLSPSDDLCTVQLTDNSFISIPSPQLCVMSRHGEGLDERHYK